MKYRLDVAFFSRFYLSVNQKESDPHHNRGLGAFLEESAALLQLHDRQPTQTTSKGRGKASLVRDRLTEFILLDGRPDTENSRQSIRSQLDGMQQQGQRWQYLIDRVNLDVLVLLPPTVTAYSMRMT